MATPAAEPSAIVREFYANAWETQSGISFVWGIQVNYFPPTIHEVFLLPTLPAGQINWVIAERFDTHLNQVITYLCVLGTQWAIKLDTDTKTNFPHIALNRYAKACNHFICTNLMPSTHYHDVTVDRAIILLGIITKKYIDI